MNKNEQIIKTELAKKVFTSEMSKDYSLPDYQPEIKRLMKISANVLPPKMDFGMDDAVFSGNIDYYVLYLGVDNQMYCAPISDEYSVNMPLDADRTGDFSDGFVDIVSEAVNGRVTAPRKITIRTRLKSSATVFSNVYENEVFSGGNYEDSIKKLSGTVMSADMKRAVSDTFTVTDEVILDTREGDVRVICADGKVMLSEVKGNNNEMFLRGDAYVKIIACKENAGEPYVIYRKLPIFANVPLEGANVDASLFARGSVNELSVIVDEGRISLEVGVVFDCMSWKNIPVTYTKDMYSTACVTSCEYMNYNVVSDGGGGFFNFTSSEARTLEEVGIPDDSRFVDASGVAQIDSVEYDDTRMKFSGRTKYNVLIESGGEYSSKEIELPFSFVADNKRGVKDVFCCAEAVSTRGKIDGERISLDSEIALTYQAYGKERISTLYAMHFGEGVDKKRNQTVVIFPSGEDSVWSIAKKNYVSPEKIMNGNAELLKNKEGVELDSTRSLLSVHHIII